jgi:hypothetical protein
MAIRVLAREKNLNNRATKGAERIYRNRRGWSEHGNGTLHVTWLPCRSFCLSSQAGRGLVTCYRSFFRSWCRKWLLFALLSVPQKYVPEKNHNERLNCYHCPKEHGSGLARRPQAPIPVKKLACYNLPAPHACRSASNQCKKPVKHWFVAETVSISFSVVHVSVASFKPAAGATKRAVNLAKVVGRNEQSRQNPPKAKEAKTRLHFLKPVVLLQ